MDKIESTTRIFYTVAGWLDATPPGIKFAMNVRGENLYNTIRNISAVSIRILRNGIP